MLNLATIMAVARHLLTFLGGIMVSTGWLDAGMVEQFTGAVLALLGIFWSIYEKLKIPPAVVTTPLGLMKTGD